MWSKTQIPCYPLLNLKGIYYGKSRSKQLSNVCRKHCSRHSMGLRSSFEAMLQPSLRQVTAL